MTDIAYSTPWVLTLGDGSLSFSLALMKKFLVKPIPNINVLTNTYCTNATIDEKARLGISKQNEDGVFQLVATTFDSPSDLILKFRESQTIRSQLLLTGAAVVGNVDATNICRTLNATFQNELNNIESFTTSASSLEDSKVHVKQTEFKSDDLKTNDLQNQSIPLQPPCPNRFDIIIFNNPHTGEENFLRHQILLRHYFHSSLPVLAKNGQIWIALADEQPVRWEVLEIAKKQGLVCILRTELNEELWPGYNHKRHQNNQSFPVSYMEHFVFMRETDIGHEWNLEQIKFPNGDKVCSQNNDGVSDKCHKVRKTYQTSDTGTETTATTTNASIENPEKAITQTLHSYCTQSINMCFESLYMKSLDEFVEIPKIDIKKMIKYKAQGFVASEKQINSKNNITLKIEQENEKEDTSNLKMLLDEIESQKIIPQVASMGQKIILPSKIPKALSSTANKVRNITVNGTVLMGDAEGTVNDKNVTENLASLDQVPQSQTISIDPSKLTNKNGKPLTSREIAKLERLQARIAKDIETKRLKSEKALLKHNHKEEQNDLQCTYCLASLNQETTIDNEEKPINISHSTSLDQSSTHHLSKSEYLRKKKTRIFPSEVDLQKHIIAKHTNLNLNVGNVKNNTPALEKKEISSYLQDDLKFACSVCEMTFPSFDHYQMHFTNLLPASEQYPCHGCYKVFSNVRALQQHMLFSKHTSD